MNKFGIYNVNAPDFEKRAKEVAPYLKALGKVMQKDSSKVTDKEWDHLHDCESKLRKKYPDIDEE